MPLSSLTKPYLTFQRAALRRLFERGVPEKSIYVSNELGFKLRDNMPSGYCSERHIGNLYARFAQCALGDAYYKMDGRFSFGHPISCFMRDGLPTTQSVIDILRGAIPIWRSWIKNHIRSSDLGIQDINISDQSEKKGSVL